MKIAIRILVGLVVILVIAAVVFPLFAKAKMGGGPSSMSILKQISTGIFIYENDFDDRLPGALWMDALIPYTKSEPLFHAREIQKEHPGAYGIAFNSLLLNQETKLVRAPESFPMIYESSSLARNSIDPFSSLPFPARHPSGNFVGYVDGHCQQLKPVN